MPIQESKKNSILLHSGTNEVEFIEFVIGDTSYGINVAKVQRVIARPAVEITHGSNDVKSAMMGTIYVQDKPVRLLDLRKALRLSITDGAEVAEDRQLILVTKFNKRVVSFLIDSVNKIHRTSWSEFQPIDMMNADPSGEETYVTGTIKIEGRVIVILDLEHLILEFLPQREDALNSIQVDDSDGLLEQRKKVKIVYAEDSRIIRKMMLNTLKEHGYVNVSHFEDGAAAHEYIAQLKAEAEAEGLTLADKVGCVITDIEMPRMDGLTLCKSIKDASKSEKEIPSVVVYSSLVNDEMANKCRSVGADAQICKPHGDEIVMVLDKICLPEEYLELN